MIRLKRAYEPAKRGDGHRVLVDRLWPRGLRKDEADLDEWLKDIAPSDALRKWFHHDPSRWVEFRRRYLRELRAAPDQLERLTQRAKKGVVTLVYSAHDADRNNAVVLAKVIDRRLRPRRAAPAAAARSRRARARAGAARPRRRAR